MLTLVALQHVVLFQQYYSCHVIILTWQVLSAYVEILALAAQPNVRVLPLPAQLVCKWNVSMDVSTLQGWIYPSVRANYYTVSHKKRLYNPFI